MLNINFWNIAFTVINLLVLYFFMRHFLVKPMRAILEERKQMVERDLDDATRSKQEAEKMKREYEASIQNAGAEADKIVEMAKTRGTEEYNRILAQAKTDAAKKMEEADRTIALEREKTLTDLRASVADLAMAAAAKLLSEQNGPQNDRNCYDTFLSQSGERHD
ncbi:F0F1 ATP synthase subunit B [Brotaphodocola sp.]|uniref:F0F1 ATP synthase subunit B n=1 Tax=Brotaphodocola sp. TaxID=3073577 RepID=UPI003D7CDECF